MNLSEITDKLRNGTYSFVVRKRARSIVWEKLRNVNNENGDEIPNIVACCECFEAIQNNNSVTTNLMRHPCVARIVPNSSNLIQVTTADKKVNYL